MNPLASLRRYARPTVAQEHCGLCDLPIAEEHPHLVEVASRKMVCACNACAILFGNQEGAKFRRVPDRVRFLPDFQLSDVAWAGLMLPIDLAFFVRSTSAVRVLALYPSPGGATEALVSEEAWKTLEEENPVLRGMQPDVEALLVNRIGETRECYLVGIDECYRLVGLIRKGWRGLSGGDEVWSDIGGFFAGLKGRSEVKGGRAGA
jgi:Family of unknown function (DUF5947)